MQGKGQGDSGCQRAVRISRQSDKAANMVGNSVGMVVNG
jgi:hypothetical protein